MMSLKDVDSVSNATQPCNIKSSIPQIQVQHSRNAKNEQMQQSQSSKWTNGGIPEMQVQHSRNAIMNKSSSKYILNGANQLTVITIKLQSSTSIIIKAVNELEPTVTKEESIQQILFVINKNS